MNFRQSLNSAWNRATGGRRMTDWPIPDNVSVWRHVDGHTRMAIAARILEQQDQEPWKRKFDAYPHDLNVRRAKREAGIAWVEQHPWQAFIYLAVRKMFK